MLSVVDIGAHDQMYVQYRTLIYRTFDHRADHLARSNWPSLRAQVHMAPGNAGERPPHRHRHRLNHRLNGSHFSPIISADCICAPFANSFQRCRLPIDIECDRSPLSGKVRFECSTSKHTPSAMYQFSLNKFIKPARFISHNLEGSATVHTVSQFRRIR